jgi:hypothetical protein
MISGQRQLAEALRVSVSTVNKYVNDRQWQLWGLSKSGPWSDEDVTKAREFQAKFYPGGLDELGSDSGDPLAEIRSLSPERQAKLRLVIERATNLRVDRRLKELKLGDILTKEEVERGRVERVTIARRELGNIRSLALKLPIIVSDLAKAEEILEQWAIAVCRKFEGPEGA